MKRLHSSQYSLDLYTNSSLDDGLSMSEGSRNRTGKLKKVTCRVCREEVNFQSYPDHLKVKHPQENPSNLHDVTVFTWMCIFINHFMFLNCWTGVWLSWMTAIEDCLVYIKIWCTSKMKIWCISVKVLVLFKDSDKFDVHRRCIQS